MSSNTEHKVTDNSNEWNHGIEEAIAKCCLKCYENKHFNNVQEIGSGVFGKVYRANWKNSQRYLALKFFFNHNNSTVREIVHEVMIIQMIYFCLYNI